MVHTQSLSPSLFPFRSFLSFKMSSRSNVQMSSGGGIRSAIVLPDDIRAVLEIRQRDDITCPPDVDIQLAKIPFFRKKVAAATAVTGVVGGGNKSVPTSFRSGSGMSGASSHHRSSSSAAAPANSRFGNLSQHSPNSWRSGGGTGGGSSGFATNNSRNNTGDHEDGWTTVLNRRKRTTVVAVEAAATVAAVATTTNDTAVATAGGDASTVGAAVELVPSVNAWKPTRFQTMETKLNESVEDRILGKVRSKINKIGESTYDATKGFMQQILDAGETEFLDECMKFIFQKAATEPSFCGLYARLLHELADEFSHLRDEMQRKFRDYTTIFCETVNTVDVGTENYGAFIEAQERKKFRRGYSQFVAELAKYGEVNVSDFRSLIEQIVRSVQEVCKVPENTLVCEEYVDCLSKMCVASATILSKADWIRPCLDMLREVSGSPRTVSPGLTNKAKFAIMDILDFARAGWRKAK